MISTFAFEIGGAFLLAALMMYGTMSGYLPRFAGGKAGLVLFGLVAAFAVYHFAPEIAAAWISAGTTAPRLSSSRPSAVTSAPVIRAPRNTTAWPKKTATAPAATAVIEPDVPHIDGARSISPEPAEAEPAELDPDPSSGAAYESGIKRGAKKLGRFLHIGGRKDPASK